jgi:hypothetical protein
MGSVVDWEQVWWCYVRAKSERDLWSRELWSCLFLNVKCDPLNRLVDEYSNPAFVTMDFYVDECREFLGRYYHGFPEDFSSEHCAKCYLIGNRVITCDHARFHVIIAAHQRHNKNLLRGTVHPGCRASGIRCEMCKICDKQHPNYPDGCIWVYDEPLCECCNIPFIWKVDHLDDWMTFSIFNKHYIGHPEPDLD